MRRALAVAVLLASAGRLGAEDYLEAYRRGFNAFNLFRWERAAIEMRKAIALNPRESARVHIQLLAWKPYVPHFYLGISLAKSGRCPEAVPALRESLRQGVLPDDPDWRGRAERTLKDCGASSPLPREVQIAQAEPSPAAAQQPPGRNEPAPIDPGPVDRAPRSAAATSPVPALSAPPGPAPATGGGNDGAEREDAAAVANARRALRQAVDRARRALVSVPKSETSREAALLRERVERADPASDSTAVLLSTTNGVTAATADLERWLRARTQTNAPPAGLVAGVEAYLRGEYAAAVPALEPAGFADDRSRAWALLFRAAAQHALFLIGGGRDSALQAAAAADVRAWRRLRRDGSPDARVFSPKFVRFVQQTGL